MGTGSSNLVSPAALLQRLQTLSLQFFLDNYQRGVFLDNANNTPGWIRTPGDDMGSIASMGYGMAVLANAAKRGLADRSVVRTRVLETLNAGLQLPHYKGWLCHFVHAATYACYDGSEYSTIDTVLFLYGAHYAKLLLGDAEISKLVDQLTDRLDWDEMLTNGGQLPWKRTLSMGYRDGKFEPAEWDKYSETPMLVLMGIGLGKLGIDTWWSWERQYIDVKEGAIMGGDESLFIHQFLMLYLGDTPIDDGFPAYFENSRRATLYNRRFTVERPTLYAKLWGLSAAPMPFGGYKAYGPNEGDHDGTVCPNAALASLVFFPDTIPAEASAWVARYSESYLLGRYGFYESFNEHEKWRADQVIGISAGPLYQAIANLNDGTAFAADFRQVPFVRRGLEQIREQKARYAAKMPSLWRRVHGEEIQWRP